MSWFNSVVRELFGLFVDDGSFAVAILVWLALIWLLPQWVTISAGWVGVILFAGLAAILIESALRRARQP
jgi:hypothetical protein